MIFRGVSFFNLPDEWRDTDIDGDNLLRLSNVEEFQMYHPDFDCGDKHVFAIDIYFGRDEKIKHTFFIIADHIIIEKCLPGDCRPSVE
jgi:hypothetical protein